MPHQEKPVGADRWQAICEGVVFQAVRLLRRSGRTATTASVLEIIREIPSSPKTLVNSNSYLARCVNEARLEFGETDQLFDQLEQFARMTFTRRALLEASIAGVMLGFNTAD